jgi:hypothetical protein
LRIPAISARFGERNTYGAQRLPRTPNACAATAPRVTVEVVSGMLGFGDQAPSAIGVILATLWRAVQNRR